MGTVGPSIPWEMVLQGAMALVAPRCPMSALGSFPRGDEGAQRSREGWGACDLPPPRSASSLWGCRVKAES